MEEPWSIEDAIEICHAQRIGHGRTLIDDEKLIQKVIDKNIYIESCPSSNVQINLTPNFESHPIKETF
jgi:adenosine deaminase